MEEYHYQAAGFIAREFLGILFLIQGYDKVFNIGMKEVIRTTNSELGGRHLPVLLTTLSAYYTSYVEFFGGLFLIIGFLKYYVLFALGIDILMVAVAMGLINPLWKTDLVLSRLSLILLLLLIPADWDLFLLDNLLQFIWNGL